MSQESKSIRVERVERALREVVGAYLSRTSSLFGGALVTVIRVSCSPDLRNALVFVSIFGGEEDEVLEILEEERGLIQSRVGKELPMKYCPKLKFIKDGSVDKLVKFSEILNSEKTDQTGDSSDPSEN